MKVKRPDGRVIDVTDKAWRVIYSQHPGYELVKAKADKKPNDDKD